MQGQFAVEATTNEIPKLSQLLDPLPIQGAVVSPAALHTQHDTTRNIVENKHADYLFTVKDNQATLRQDIEALKLSDFPPQHTTFDKAHGRLELRHIRTSCELNGYLSILHVGQVFCIHHDTTRLLTCKKHRETVYGITRLSPQRTDPARVFALTRAHWRIEKQMLWIRDVTFDEHRCHIQKGVSARMMA